MLPVLFTASYGDLRLLEISLPHRTERRVFFDEVGVLMREYWIVGEASGIDVSFFSPLNATAHLPRAFVVYSSPSAESSSSLA